MLKEKNNINKVFEYIFIILFFYLSVKKAGFYKTDILMFSFALQIVAVIYIIFKYIKNKEKRKFDIVGTLSIMLSVSYLLPVIFSNTVSVNDGLTEFIRYFNLYLIYKLVLLSDNKKIYKNFLVYLGIFLGILGIDGMGARVLEEYLNKINSGYLNMDFDRMSSVIQYANTFAIILDISSLCVFSKLTKKIKEKETKSIIAYHTVFLFLVSCIILSQSRVVISLLFLGIIFYYLKNVRKKYDKKENYILLTLIFFTLLESMIYSSFVLRSIRINLFAIYYLTLILILVNVAIIILGSILFKKIKNKKILKRIFEEKNIKKAGVIFCLSFLVYIILAMFVTTDLKIAANSNLEVKRYAYNVENGAKNNIKFTVDSLEEDTRYKIEIFAISNKNEKKLVKTFSYYDTVSR